MQYTEDSKVVKMTIPSSKCLIFLIFLLKTLIAGTGWNRLDEAVLKSTHNLCFRAIRNIGIPQYFYIKVQGGISRTCFSDEERNQL